MRELAEGGLSVENDAKVMAAFEAESNEQNAFWDELKKLEPSAQRPEKTPDGERAFELVGLIAEKDGKIRERERLAAQNHTDMDSRDAALSKLREERQRLSDELDSLIGRGAGSGGKDIRWTPERLGKLKAYREKHGTKKAAEYFGITEARVRKLLPREKPKQRGYSAFTQSPK